MVSNMTRGCIFTQPLKSPKSLGFWVDYFLSEIISTGYFYPTYVRFELKKHRGVIFHETEQWCIIWINPDLVVSKLAWGIGWTYIRATKSLKIVYWWTLFVQSICFSLKISEELYAMTLKSVAKLKQKLTCGLKNDIRNWVNFHASSQKSTNLHFDWILLSKAYKYWDEKVQKTYVSWHWRVMPSLKKNWLLIPKMTWRI